MSDARGFSPRWIIAILFCFNLFTQYLHAANIVGTVIDENTGFGIEGVTVTLDLDPVGGLPDATATTGPFGYYRIEEIVSGPGFTLTASHPAYDNESKTEGTLVADESRVLSFALNRSNEGVTILDIQVSVRAVNSGNLLANVPIHAWRFSTSDGSDPADFRTVRTDNNGNADFRGFEAGFFQFSINEASDSPLVFYESYPNPAGRTPLTDLSTDHVITALLKHIPQTLTIRVRGFDPVGEVSSSLEGAIVELTGLGEDQVSRIVPTRTSESVEDGRVTFFDLPPIPWEVKVKLLGYDVLTEIIEPDGTGALPSGDNDMILQIQPRALALTLNAEGFANVDWLFENIPVKLEGIPDTNTEGISREETAAGNFSGQNRHDERIFR
ncbi:MAG: carboxypeptidase-like regulatory domain-containing protein, partial [Verrucomicrobia bacterium]|nr:carboxypeptidase-like regulatory domain-containing protein [Verrucomicrobiota bacterium]